MNDRHARLTVSLSGTNLERAADYNQRVVLQAIRLQSVITRTELVALTGLSAPTIANISRRLVTAGLVRVVERVQQGRGLPAVRLAIEPDGAFGIGINIDRDHLTFVVLDLAGTVRARVSVNAAYALPDQVRAFIARAVTECSADLGVMMDRIVGVGVAVPEPFSKSGFHDMPESYAVWNSINIVEMLKDTLPWPIFVDNDAAAAALGELEFGSDRDCHSFFYLLISAGLGGGLVIDGSFYRGASGRSGEIGYILSRAPASNGRSIESRVSISALYDRLSDAGCESGTIEALKLDNVHTRDVITAWIAEAAVMLVDPMIAVNCLLNPQAVLVGGRLPEPIIDALVAAMADALAVHASDMPSVAPIRRAEMAADAPAVGAALLPFSDRMLPFDAILMNVGRE
jgi:predicted NBD/HSP70 family sugar kinase